MKRIICFLIVLSCLALTVNANPNMQADVGSISVPNAAPTVDGNITDTEGWSETVYAYKDIMATFGNTNDILQSFYLYYAYDSEGLYYAADIIDNSFVLSTGEDNIDNVVNDFNIKNENVYGYNGDIFTLTLDPLGKFLYEGYMGNTDYNSWYSVGIFENNICRMYRGHNLSGDVTDEVKLAGHTTDAGWCFEAFIPWSFFCRDAEDMSFGDVSVTEEEMAAGGASHRAMVIYMDRFYDSEAEEIATYQRFATCGYILADGLMGYLSSGVCLKAYGISLDLQGGEVTDDTASADTTSRDTTAPQTEQNGTTANTTEVQNNGTTPSTTKTQSTKAPTGSSSAQTGDLGVGIAIGALVIAVIVFIFLKKR